jgi:pimeloyl-ACP methyl ester carboxylesterase
MLPRVCLFLLILLALFIEEAGSTQPGQQAAARSVPSPDPPLAVIAGNRLTLVDRSGHVWVRALPIAPEAPWIRVALPGNRQVVTQLSCAPGGSGTCAVLLGVAPGTRIGLLSADSTVVTDLNVPASAIVRFLDRETLYFTRRTQQDGAQLFAYDVSTNQLRPAGIVRRGELLEAVLINEQPALIVRSRTDGSGRTLDREPAIRFPSSFPDIDLLSPWGMLFMEDWQTARPALEGHRSLRSIELRADARGQVSSRANILISLSTEGPLIDEGSLTISGAGDIYGTTTSSAGRAIVVACRNAEGRLAFAPVRRMAPNESVRLFATPAGAGLVAFVGTEATTAQIHVLRLGGPPRPPRSARPCADITLQAADAGVPTTDLPPNWVSEMQAAALPDGTRLPFVVYRPADAEPEHLIVDVYGAYGQIRHFSPPTPEVLDRLGRAGTALAVIAVRGDGNAGFASAMASRAPYRQRAVDDLIAVTARLRARFPQVARVTARGRSAGAWLAVMAALQRPDLFAGAIGMSGAYVFSEDRLGASEGSFFSPDDSFERNGRLTRADCSRLQFRLMHARDDAITSFDQAQQFAAMLNDRGCATELIAFDVGGHGLARTLPPPDDRRELDAYNMPLVPKER